MSGYDDHPEDYANVPSRETINAGLTPTQISEAAGQMSWVDIMANVARGAINITEGLTTIERGSRVHVAMLALCVRFTAIANGREALPPQFKANAAHLAGYAER